ncbi:hypothetical protein [Paenirhodobacter populi]|uniref:hypothetical protein n=1 Tax=Paenirhodobacter populi TaxID=2306993 RepID=UPI000FE41073|nr:hypothetical protein [Sinirhodobacter populi]RWR09765.1 hypothetical protein D2T32_05335 [Sinirhodobacter populi]
MAGPAVIIADAEELIQRAITEFATWAAEHWKITEAEALTLTTPTTSPAEYARGYCEAIRSLPDAAQHWLEEGDLYDE